MASEAKEKPPVTTAAPEDPMPEGDDRGERAETSRSIVAGGQGGSGSGGAGFFTLYKPGQGYWTRLGTVLGATLLALLTAWQIYRYMPVVTPWKSHGLALGIATGFFLAIALLIWWLTNKPANADFLIATDGEMKKVNWTSRRELIGSTKVVILFMFLIALFLFVADQLFWILFYLLGVLKVSPFSHGGGAAA